MADRINGTKHESMYNQAAGNEKETEVDPSETTALYNAENGDVTIQSPAMSSSGSVDRKFLYIAACTVNIASFVCGMHFGWTSPEIPKFKATDSPFTEPLTKGEESWVGSLLPVGAAVGPLVAGVLADRIGRKKTLLISNVPFIIAFLLMAFATNVHFLLVARFLSGLAVGSIFTVLPMYIGEIADNEVRGSLGTFMQLFITLGLLFSYALGPYIPIKVFNLMSAVIPLAFIVVFYLFIPESPHYLLQIDDSKEAEKSLMKFRNKDSDGVRKELADIEIAVKESMANKANFMDIFKSRGLTMALIISVTLVTIQQFSGINIVLFYTQDIFDDAGSTLSPDISTIIIGVVQVIASCVGPALIEKKGKKFFLLLSAAGMAVSLGILAMFFYIKSSGSDVTSIGWIPVVSLVAYIITYCVGFGPVPWAVMGELFPGEIKSAASTVTASGCWLEGFLITKYFNLVSGLIGKSGAFGFFAICCVAGLLFVVKLVPETTGKSCQEIQDILNGNASSEKKGENA